MARLDDLMETKEDSEDWLPIADMMTGLFVVFLFIAIVALQYVSKVIAVTGDTPKSVEMKTTILDDYTKRLQKIDNVIVHLEMLRTEIYNALHKEFEPDLQNWQAEIDKETLSFRFSEPRILFLPSQSKVRPKFKEVLNDFFPRYIKVLKPYLNDIDNIRIEGHTSSEWNRVVTEKEAFLNNMRLSQDRTQSVLVYCLNLPFERYQQAWIRLHVTANGFSSTKLIRDAQGKEDKKASRRVEFRIELDNNQSLNKIKEKLKNG